MVVEGDVVRAPSGETKSATLFFPGERNPEAPGHRLDVEFGRLSAFKNGLDDVRVSLPFIPSGAENLPIRSARG